MRDRKALECPYFLLLKLSYFLVFKSNNILGTICALDEALSHVQLTACIGKCMKATLIGSNRLGDTLMLIP